MTVVTVEHSLCLKGCNQQHLNPPSLSLRSDGTDAAVPTLAMHDHIAVECEEGDFEAAVHSCCPSAIAYTTDDQSTVRPRTRRHA